MKKNLFLLTLALFFVLVKTTAQLRSEKDALQIAKSFVEQSNPDKLRSDAGQSALQLAYISEMPTEEIFSIEDNAYYYVYNLPENKGFVIVSGNENARTILGYSDEGNFDINTIPDNFRSWLSFYERELKLLSEMPEGTVISSSLRAAQDKVETSGFATSISPLIKTKWDQDAPYNYQCPIVSSSRSAVGCTAVSAGQIMNYHQWPKKGKGSFTYSINGKNTTVDFSQTTYDWKNMKNTYPSTIPSSDPTAIAVSTLLYHVGFAAQSSYGESTGAYTGNMARAIIEYFDYDPNMQVYQRMYFTKTEWENLIKKELNASRPIHYAGYNSNSGHAFVCDGYDANGLFHFNWGWSGLSDGYFELSALTPGSLGIGAGSGSYNENQEIIVGIQPPNANSSYNPQIYFKNLNLMTAATINRNGTFQVRLNQIFNRGIYSYSGQFALGLYNKNDELVGTFGNYTFTDLKAGYGSNAFNLSSNFSSNVSNGDYKMRVVQKEKNAADWKIIQGKTGTLTHFNVVITSNQVTFSEPPELFSNLTVDMSGVATQTFYKDRAAKLKVVLKNTGGGDYNSFLYLAFSSGGTDLFAEKVPIVVGAGETKELVFSGVISKNPGNYNIHVFYDRTNTYDETSKVSLTGSNPIPIKVENAGTNINLDLNSKIAFENNNYVTPGSFKMTVDITNKGDYFDGHIFAATEVESGRYTSFESQYIILNSGERTVLEFTNPPSVAFGTVEVATFHRSSITSSQWFSTYANCFVSINYVDDPHVGIPETSSDSKAISVYPNPVDDILYLKSEKTVKAVSIFDFSGRKQFSKNISDSGEISIPVNFLAPGLYLIQVETPAGKETLKIQKK